MPSLQPGVTDKMWGNGIPCGGLYTKLNNFGLTRDTGGGGRIVTSNTGLMASRRHFNLYAAWAKHKAGS